MSGPQGGKQRATSVPRGANSRRRTNAQSLELQLAIVSSRDVHSLTWAAIAGKHGIGEKEARETYARYHKEIAPLIVAASPSEQVHEYLRAYENLRQRLFEIADNADNDSARVGALREFRNTLSKEIELRQHVGLMPKHLGEAHDREDRQRLGERIVEVLHRHHLPPEVFGELAAAFHHESEQ